MTDSIRIHPIPALQDNYIWVILDSHQKNAVIVDPGAAEPVLAFLEQEKCYLQSILVTHHHRDHTQGIHHITKLFPVPVYGSEHSPLPEVTHRLAEGGRIPQQHSPLPLQALGIPGHTHDHLAFHGAGLLFCGDTLFACGCGRIFEGTPVQMYTSLQKLAALPDDTRIYCGHEYTLKNLQFAKQVEPENRLIAQRLEYVTQLRNQKQPSLPSTLGLEKDTNPFLRCTLPQVRHQVANYANAALDTPLDVFTWLRKWKDSY